MKPSPLGISSTKADPLVETSTGAGLSSRNDQSMRLKIKEQMLKADLEQQERSKPREENPYMMTREELLAGGWAVLSMKPEDVRDVVSRLNAPITYLTTEDYYE
jgi:hypothetical protein